MLRTVGLLFGLSMILTACDPSSFFDLLGGLGGGGSDDPVAEAPEDPGAVPVGNDEGDADDVSDESDQVSDESDPVSDESDPVSDESEPEHRRCFRNRGEAEAAGEDEAGDEGAGADEAAEAADAV